MFRQFMLDVEASRRVLFSHRGGISPEQLASSLTIYSYAPREGEDLFAIAARCNIPYGTLASLNRFSHVDDLTNGRSLLLPSVPGIFIPETPVTDIERLLFASRAEDGETQWLFLSIPREGKTERLRFIPGADFSPTERVFFLNRGFRFPLQNFQVSSFYGPRINPVTGRHSIHQGLDLAAPEGAEVYAVRSGIVVDLGEDPVLGKYVIISHDNNWLSLYGHLSAINTVLRTELQSGTLIGKVGSTGQSTGPHLHFELRQNGQARDPARLLRIFEETTGR
jgi:murein DD-endopeptidase MepM/ murein hydrolase activator NlpD